MCLRINNKIRVRFLLNFPVKNSEYNGIKKNASMKKTFLSI